MNVQDQKLESRTHQRGRAEAAERKLATLRSETIQECADWITETELALPIAWHMGTKDALVKKFALCLASCLRMETLDKHCYLCSEETLDSAKRVPALAQIEQPQDTPTNHISAHPPAPSAEVQELRNTSADWQKQFHQLESLCKARGLTVGYGDHGQVTLSEEPKQQRPGEDPPIDACQCPACVTIRAMSRSSHEL